MILVSNIFYHFLYDVSLGNKASKMSEKFRLDCKITFRNTFYTKCINVIIDSIGPSIILRSIFLLTVPRWYFFCGSFVLFMYCLSCFRVCSLMLCGHLLGKSWPLGSCLWCLLCFCYFPMCYPGSGMWYFIVSFPDLCHLSYFVTNFPVCRTWQLLLAVFQFRDQACFFVQQISPGPKWC